MPSLNKRLEEFKASITGAARANRFEILISAGAFSPDSMILGKATSFPGQTLSQIELPYFGRKVKIPGVREYSEWNVTLYAGLKEYEKFSNWQNSISSTDYPIKRDDEFRYGEATVTIFSTDEKNSTKYNIENIWPMSIGELQAASESRDALSEFTVTFIMQSYKIEPTEEAGT